MKDSKTIRQMYCSIPTLFSFSRVRASVKCKLQSVATRRPYEQMDDNKLRVGVAWTRIYKLSEMVENRISYARKDL
jgi:hypothetical protein